MKILRIAVCVIFISSIWLPVLQMNFHFFKEFDDVENRELAAAPKIRWGTLGSIPAGLNAYLEDHFGFRPNLIRWHCILKTSLLGVSPIPAVLLGKQSWFFYCSEALGDGNTFNDHTGAIPLSASELEKLRIILEENQRQFARRHILYLVVIVPNKNTVYPEFLPDYIRKFRPATRLDQLTDFMKTRSRVEILDLRDTMREARAKHPPYLKTDSHWNSYGAFTGYLRIAQILSQHFPEIQIPFIEGDKVALETSPKGGDLAQMLFMRDLLPEENNTLFTLSPESPNPPLNTLILRHDSFGDSLYPYFRRHFKRIFNIAPFAPYDYDTLSRQQAEVALHVFAERYITQALHDDFYYRD